MTSFVTESELTSPDTHLFISPHYDDIALSCGGTAALVTDAGKDGVVALLFGDHPDPGQPMTSFAEQMHRDWGMSADRVIAGTDCGFGTFAGIGKVDPDVAYKKLASLVAGAELASRP